MTTETMPKGYKRTEAGVIPEEWEAVSLGDVLTLIADYTANGSFEALKNNVRYYQDDNFAALVRTTDLEKYQFNPERFTDEKGYKFLKKTSLFGGEIVIANVGSVGKAYRVPFFEKPMTLAPNTYLLRFDEKRILDDFISHWMQSQDFVQKILGKVGSTTLLAINKDNLRSIITSRPGIAEQQTIAAALSDADVLIESLEQLIAKKRQIKQGAMQELLTGKRRLPGFTGKWCEAILSNFLLSTPDYGINAPGVPDTGAYPKYLRITDITDDGRFAPPVQAAVNHPESSRYILSKDEIVFARTGASVGKSYLYKDADGELVFAGFLIRAKIDPSKLSPEYLAAYTHTAEYWNWVRLMSMRSGQPGINGQEYASMSFRIPPTLSEQTAIASVLSDMDAELEVLEGKLDKARQVKQGMMQQLLTGKVRLV
jgi:type I restriction enzyme S subunit